MINESNDPDDAPVFTEAAYLRALAAIDRRAVAAYLVVRSASRWECYPYEHAGGALVATMRPKSGELAKAPAQFTPKQFATLAHYARETRAGILDALTIYLTHRWYGRPAEALAMTGELDELEAIERERHEQRAATAQILAAPQAPLASGGAGMSASLTVVPAADDHRED